MTIGTLAFAARSSMAVAALLSLGGCVGSLLGGGKPDALYRFGGRSTAVRSSPIALPRRTLIISSPAFAPAVGGDRILTTQGNETSYIKDMRWVAPAPELYSAAIHAAIADRIPDVVVGSRGPIGVIDAVLSVSVDRFEVVYAAPGDAAPSVRIEGDATLSDPSAKRIIGRYRIAVTNVTESNTGPGVAAAFDAAVDDSVIGLADWVNGSVPVTLRRSSSSGR